MRHFSTRVATHGEVEVFSWNPRRCDRLPSSLIHRVPIGPRVNNFGDLIGPLVVGGMVRRFGLSAPRGPAVIASVGSVIHLLPGGAVVWGSGINGKIPLDAYRSRRFDIRAVRGPSTWERLGSWGFVVPETPVFGDPAQLLPLVRPDLLGRATVTSHLVIPNLNDRFVGGPDWLDPCRPLEECLGRIAETGLVIGSSLHAIIVAESLGVPARLVQPRGEHPLKYEDYFRATGRPDFAVATSPDEALEMGGERPPRWDPGPLIDAFPCDLWLKQPPRDDA